MRTLRVNCADTIQDRPGQPENEMFGIKRINVKNNSLYTC